MNIDPNRSDLAALKRELERVEMDLRFLRVKADQIETRIAATERAAEQAAAANRPAVLPPPIPAPVLEIPPLEMPPPPIIEESFQAPPIPEPQPEPVFAQEAAFAGEPPAFATPPPIPTVEEPASFEMRLGTYWFVRIGIVMVLTAMVFLGNYAYHHFIGLLGPLGKVALLYAASFLLLGLGWWLPRKQDRLQNYGQVLFAGGLAAVYFTTYAAHHFPNLRIIQSAVLDGVLLLMWTAFIVWLADRKKSEILAVFAIGLAYYTAMITNVGSFTLISNLLLASAAVFFLIRNRWVNLTFLSLIASYGSYFYWRYYTGSTGVEDQPARLALAGYWIIFTVAAFFTRHEDFTGKRRASFLSFNNGAAFALLTFSFLRQGSDDFWKLSLGSGALLLVLAAAARRFLADDEYPRRAYLAQGLLLTTLGIMTKLSGPTLALVLAVESAALVIFSTQWNSRLLRNSAVIVGLLAAVWLVLRIGDQAGSAAWWKGAGGALMLLFNAGWIGRHSGEGHPAEFRGLPTYYAMIGLICWTSVVFAIALPGQVGLLLALSGLALTAATYTVRVREITILSQGLVAVAQVHTLFALLRSIPESPWGPLTVVLVSLALAVWWKHQTAIAVEPNGALFMQAVASLASAVILFSWLPREFLPNTWILVSIGLTVGWTLLGKLTRTWSIAAAGQIFLLGTALISLYSLTNKGEPSGDYVALLVISFVGLAAAPRVLKSENESVLGISTFYQWAGAALALAGIATHIDPAYRFLALAVLFAISFAAATFGAAYALGPGIMLAVAGFFFWMPTMATTGAQPQNLLAILLIGAMQFVSRKTAHRLPVSDSAHGFWIGAVAVALWIYISRWVIVHSQGAHFYLTASWAALAFIFFVAGFLLRERTYRWAAVGVLACALGRVVILDVWRLQTLYRILSFAALGAVLLALGYFYNRFQEKIARWL